MTKRTFLVLLIIAVLIRLFLNRLPSFEIDMNAWLAWALRMKELGPGKFYSDTVWTQYTPLYLY